MLLPVSIVNAELVGLGYALNERGLVKFGTLVVIQVAGGLGDYP